MAKPWWPLNQQKRRQICSFLTAFLSEFLNWSQLSASQFTCLMDMKRKTELPLSYKTTFKPLPKLIPYFDHKIKNWIWCLICHCWINSSLGWLGFCWGTFTGHQCTLYRRTHSCIYLSCTCFLFHLNSTQKGSMRWMRTHWLGRWNSLIHLPGL